MAVQCTFLHRGTDKQIWQWAAGRNCRKKKKVRDGLGSQQSGAHRCSDDMKIPCPSLHRRRSVVSNFSAPSSSCCLEFRCRRPQERYLHINYLIFTHSYLIMSVETQVKVALALACLMASGILVLGLRALVPLLE